MRQSHQEQHSKKFTTLQRNDLDPQKHTRHFCSSTFHTDLAKEKLWTGEKSSVVVGGLIQTPASIPGALAFQNPKHLPYDWKSIETMHIIPYDSGLNHTPSSY